MVLEGVLLQAASILSLIFGIIVAEALTYKVFGKPKPMLVIVDIIVFVLVLSAIYTFFSFSQMGYFYYPFNFIVGLFLVVGLRSLEGAFGLTERPAMHNKLAVNIVRAMASHGFSDQEIRDVLKRSGISPKIVDDMSEMIDFSVPRYLPKIVKMNNDLESLREEVSDIKGSLHDMRTNGIMHLRSKGRTKKKARKRPKKGRRTKRKRRKR